MGATSSTVAEVVRNYATMVSAAPRRRRYHRSINVLPAIFYFYILLDLLVCGQAPENVGEQDEHATYTSSSSTGAASAYGGSDYESMFRASSNAITRPSDDFVATEDGQPQIRFDPPALELYEQPTCIPLWQNVDIVNDGEEEVIVDVVTSDNHMFHPSLKGLPLTIPSGESAKMQVLFLPQTVESVEAMLLVQTNLGTISYHARARSVDNQFGVNAVVEENVPAESTYAPPIVVHNPSSTQDLRILEVFTTEAFLHLSFPEQSDDGEIRAGRPISQSDSFTAEHASEFWTIPPNQSKAVIFISFSSDLPGLFQGFVHLKMDRENLLVPVTIGVSKGGLQVSPDVIDFGTMISSLTTKPVPLTITNTGKDVIELQSLSLLQGQIGEDEGGNEVLVQRFLPVVVAPQETVTFARIAYQGEMQGFFEGRLQLITNDTASLAQIDIPYSVRLLFGSIGFQSAQAWFKSDPDEAADKTRNVFISNNFPEKLLIYSAKIADPHFSISHFNRPHRVLAPGESVELLDLNFKSEAGAFLYKTDLEINTNVTALRIPLTVYHGRLHCGVGNPLLAPATAVNGQRVPNYPSFSAKQNCFDGINIPMNKIPLGEVRKKFLVLANPNPIDIDVVSIQYADSRVTVTHELVDGEEAEDGERFMIPRALTEPLPTPISLKGGTRVFIGIEVLPDHEYDQQASFIAIRTSQNEIFEVSVLHESSPGIVTFAPEVVTFNESFPGRVWSEKLSVSHNFPTKMMPYRVWSTDKRIVPTLVSQQYLEPLHEPRSIIRVDFDPSQVEDEENYMFDSSVDQDSLFGANLTQDEIDRWTTRQGVWEGVFARNKTLIDATVYLDSDHANNVPVRVIARLTKPSLIWSTSDKTAGSGGLNAENDVKKVVFGLRQVGAEERAIIDVHNPTSAPMKAELVLPEPPSNGVTPAFSLGSGARAQILAPGETLALGPMVFSPQEHQNYSTVAYLRNNLTMLEPILLQGRGGTAKLVFNNDSILFDVSGDEMESGKPIFRTFEILNEAEVQVRVTGMEVVGSAEDSPCERSGFQVVKCEAFEVGAGESHSVEVSFLPDFTMTFLERKLKLTMDSGDRIVTLTARLPEEGFAQQADREWVENLERPNRRFCILLLTLVLGSMILVLFVEGGSLRRKKTWSPCTDFVMLADFPPIEKLAQLAGPVVAEKYKAYIDARDKKIEEEREKVRHQNSKRFNNN